MYFLPGLIRNIEFSIHDDFHLMIGVCIYERRPFLEPVKSGRDRLFGIDLVAVRTTYILVGGLVGMCGFEESERGGLP